MVEAIGGKAGLLNLGFTGGFVPFRTMKELGEVRRARRQEKQLKKSTARLMADKRRSMEDYIRDHEDGLKHAVDAVEFLYELIRNCAYDIHIIKSIIRRMIAEDRSLKEKGLPTKVARHLEEEVMQTLQQINSNLRKGSDLWGALTKE